MKKIYFIAMILLTSSCDTGEVCEAFNFKRIPYNQKYYLHQLKYTNGQDTITLLPEHTGYSKQSMVNPYSNPDCSPSFYIQYSSKRGNKLSMSYSFDYYPQDKYTTMSVIINSSRILIDVYPNSNDSIFNFEKIEYLNEEDSSGMLKNVFIKNMNAYEFETLLGEKWRLLNR